MRTSTIIAMWFLAAIPLVTLAAEATSPFDGPADPTPRTAIDQAVLGQLKKLGIQPAKVCSDPVFCRRVYLDVIGTLPTVDETARFLADRSADKRSRLIDDLLGRKEFAVYWAMKWSDLLRVKAEFPINLWPNAAQAYYRWIRSSLASNMPYDRFVREQITSSGSNFRVAPVNFYRAMQTKDPNSIAKSVALTFMGIRADKWPEDRLQAMAALFCFVGYKGTDEWKEEIIHFDTIKATKAAAEGKLKPAAYPDGTAVKLTADRDPREGFADWLIRAENPWFARNIVNRVWYWLVGRGVIHEPDDIRPDNPPANEELLALLEKELVAGRWDLKALYRLILNSDAYQLSPVARSNKPEAQAHCAFYTVRRMEAEVLIDALCQLTGTTESYSSPIPEPFTWIPSENRSIALPDGSISSAFLDMFGRSPRDTGLESERSNNPSDAQCLHMLNSSHVLMKIRNGKKMQALMHYTGGPTRDAATRLYLAIVSRYPTEAELKTVETYAQGEETKGDKALEDLAWSLINSTEFLYRH